LRIAAIGARGVPNAYSGIERACESLYTRLVTRGHHVTFYCRPEYAPNGPEMFRGILLEPTGYIATRSMDTLSSVFTALKHAVTSGRFDLVHLHAMAPGIFSFMPRLRGLPIVSTIHGLDWQRVMKLAERSLVRDATRMIVVSRDLKEYYRSTYGRLTSYIPNGVEMVSNGRDVDQSVLQSFGLKPKQYFLYLSRLVPEKRPDDLIRAYSQIQTDKKLVIAGEAGYTDRYVAELRQTASTDKRVIFTGFQRGDAVHALFQNAAASVHPSELEGLPMALLEAMSHGTIPIVSDIAPHRELLSSIPGYDLFFVPRDVAGIVRALNNFLSQEDGYEVLGAKLKELAEAHYSWDAIAAKTESLYYDAVAGGTDQEFNLSLENI
jgi:glycosyltransferase involved in cell wall biosynthesis